MLKVRVGLVATVRMGCEGEIEGQKGLRLKVRARSSARSGESREHRTSGHDADVAQAFLLDRFVERGVFCAEIADDLVGQNQWSGATNFRGSFTKERNISRRCRGLS